MPSRDFRFISLCSEIGLFFVHLKNGNVPEPDADCAIGQLPSTGMFSLAIWNLINRI
jgi:hypothetical protein